MYYKTAKDYYKLIKKEFSNDEGKFNKFYDCFEVTWFSENDDETVKYNFDLWSYNSKFNFKGKKKKLILENNLKKMLVLLIMLLKVLIIVLINA